MFPRREGSGPGLFFLRPDGAGLTWLPGWLPGAAPWGKQTDISRLSGRPARAELLIPGRSFHVRRGKKRWNGI